MSEKEVSAGVDTAWQLELDGDFFPIWEILFEIDTFFFFRWKAKYCSRSILIEFSV